MFGRFLGMFFMATTCPAERDRVFRPGPDPLSKDQLAALDIREDV